MRFSALTSLLCLLGLAACSDSTPPAPAFDDPVAAMEQADAARASGNTVTAEQGYAYALAHGDNQTQGDALLAMLELHMQAGNDSAAVQDLSRIKSDFADRVDAQSILRLCDLAIKGATTEVGEALLAFGVGQFPELKPQLAKIEKALELIRTEGPGADLSSVGYVGD